MMVDGIYQRGEPGNIQPRLDAYIGAGNQGGNYKYYGLIQYLHVYSRALEDAEILALYTNIE